jgi:glutathione S-transferase
MLVVHHLNQSRSQRVLWLLEELGVPYEVKRYQRNPATLLAPPELRQVHPLGKSPVITDGEFTLAESGAIVEYLVQRYGDGRLRPQPGTQDAVRYLYWMHYAEGSLMPPLFLKLVFERIAKAKMPFFAKPVAKAISANGLASFVEPQLKRHLDYLEQELGRSTWFAGEELTAADVQMSFPVEVAQTRADLSGRPRLRGFIERIQARPAYQRAAQKVGDFGVLT